MAQIIKVYPDNIAPRHLKLIIDTLKEGGIIIYPTDTLYSVGCDMLNQNAIERLCQIIGKKPETANLSIICYDLSNMSQFSTPIEDSIFKLMKRCLPGPYTFILKANNNVPKLFKNKKKTIGIRVPDNNIPRAIVQELGNPIVTASIHNESTGEYYNDPENIFEDFKNKVDLVIDGGMSEAIQSTVIDVSTDEVEIIREGKGDVSTI
ncbi:MAG: L-threonylcarbamoyladenylate synthase [Bacteroidota bacterium]|nr:L-threonylcarbamoyladenylate synthase [Bacteroidota bacterium]